MDGEGRGVEGDPSWISPIGTVDLYDAEDERGLEEVPVLLEDTIIHQEEQEEGTWEESCLLLFSKFLGFSIAEYKDEIFKLMNKICERRTMVKGKGVQGTTKFDKELKKLEWNVQEKEKSRRGSSSQSGKGEHSGW